MATTLLDWRPSALLAAHPSPRVVAGRTIAQLSTFMGATAAIPAVGMAVEGTGTSVVIEKASVARNVQIDAGKAQGYNARGIPPRGRRKV